jgi:mono/diheme cytochrome c family protein
MPPVDNVVEASSVGPVGKLLDRFGFLRLVVAQGIDHDARPDVPDPAATAEYGHFLARSCVGCHGEGLSGGRIPGAPADLPTPLNLTPHETGLAAWSEVDFNHFLDTGMRPDGTVVDPFMPVESVGLLNEMERSALWAYLRSLPPTELGNR